MNQPYSSPPANLRSLRDRLTQAAQRQGVVFGRLQRHVAMVVVAQFADLLTDDNGVHCYWSRVGRRSNCAEASTIHGPPKTSTPSRAATSKKSMSNSPRRARWGGRGSPRSSPSPRKSTFRACRAGRSGFRSG